MDDKDRRLIRDRLESFGDITELYEVTTFIGYRDLKRVTIRILDQGEECPDPSLRFACDATQEDGKKAGGNNAGSIDEAIGIVHWDDLD